MDYQLRTWLRQCRGALLGVGLLSAFSSILALSGSIFMLAVYDRVIPSGSVPTLVAMVVLVILAYCIQAAIDIFRGNILTRAGLVLKEALSPRVLDITIRGAARGDIAKGQSSRDLDQVQGFLSSMAPTVFFDLPWIPIYLALCFSFHFYIGLLVTAGVVLLCVVALVSELASRAPSTELERSATRRSVVLGEAQQQAEIISAMGMAPAISLAWTNATRATLAASRCLADTTTGTSTVAKVFRTFLQSAVLALGAFLVIHGDATGGIMIASSILSGRAMAPIDLAIGHWKSFIAARQSWKRLSTTLREVPPETAGFVPATPRHDLVCERLTVAVGPERRVLLRDVAFRLEAGDCMVVVGPSGAGKSTLGKALVGLMEPAGGAVRLDGGTLDHWPSAVRGGFIGYLPQASELLSGTIGQNISRHRPDATEAGIIVAARDAGVHEVVQRMPNGYDSQVRDGSLRLSGGQAQRIGLARALYGNPFLIVLDEPNSNLDGEGEAALARAVQEARSRGSIIVLVTHRQSVLQVATHMLVLNGGQVQRFGRRDDVLKFLNDATAGRHAAA